MDNYVWNDKKETPKKKKAVVFWTTSTTCLCLFAFMLCFSVVQMVSAMAIGGTIDDDWVVISVTPNPSGSITSDDVVNGGDKSGEKPPENVENPTEDPTDPTDPVNPTGDIDNKKPEDDVVIIPCEEPCFIEYMIVSGDTLSKISVRFGVSIDVLVEWNNIADRNLIITGETLMIPSVFCLNDSVPVGYPAVCFKQIQCPVTGGLCPEKIAEYFNGTASCSNGDASCAGDIVLGSGDTVLCSNEFNAFVNNIQNELLKGPCCG